MIGLLRQHGVAVRYPRVTPEEAAEMVRLHRAGVRQVDIAARFGRDPGNVWHLLKRAGSSGLPIGSAGSLARSAQLVRSLGQQKLRNTYRHFRLFTLLRAKSTLSELREAVQFPG